MSAFYQVFNLKISPNVNDSRSFIKTAQQQMKKKNANGKNGEY